MGDRRIGLVLFAAISVACLAGFGVYRFLEQAQANSRIPMARIVVAAVDLTEGHVLTATDVRLSDVPVATMPPAAFTIIDSVVGRVTRVPVFTTEALVPGRLAPVGSGAGWCECLSICAPAQDYRQLRPTKPRGRCSR